MNSTNLKRGSGVRSTSVRTDTCVGHREPRKLQGLPTLRSALRELRLLPHTPWVIVRGLPGRVLASGLSRGGAGP